MTAARRAGKMVPMYQDDDDATDDQAQAEIARELTELSNRFANAEAELRDLGIYIETTIPQPVMAIGGPRPGLVAICQLGDVAFTKRVQDPQAYATDNQLAGIEHGAVTDEWLDQRAKIAENLKAGRDPFAE